MGRSCRGSLRFVLPVCAWVIAGYAWAQDADLEARVQLAARYLIEAQQSDGLFRYEYDFVAARYSATNNDVRQSGAGFALGQYYLHQGDRAAGEALRRAVAAYDKHSVPFGEGRLVSISGEVARAKVGATALAVLGELYYQERSGDQRFATSRRAWLDGMLALQAADGGFAAYPDSGKQSAYSNGEVWLALARYHALFPGDAAVAAALVKADRKMIREYRAHPEIGFFHWGEMAAAERFRTTGDERFATFALDQAADYIERLRPRVKRGANSCYSVEGLLSALDLADAVKRGDGMRARLIARVREEMAKNARLQIGPEQTRIDLGPGRYLVSPDLRHKAGAFLNSATLPKARIDSTQHCLSAFLRYSQYLKH